MGLLRKDYILDRWVYYAIGRKKRPRDFKSIEIKDNSKYCYFCPSNEHMTPPEIGRVEYKGSWKIRWFLNKFPAVEMSVNRSRMRGSQDSLANSPISEHAQMSKTLVFEHTRKSEIFDESSIFDKKGNPNLKPKKYLLEGSSYGIHEVIVETSHHKSQLWDLPASHIREILEVCKFRINYLGRLEGIKYVGVFKNHGKDAGTSLVHSHTQVMALPQIPSLVREKMNAIRKYSRCPYCDIIKLESKSKRKIFETKNVIAFAPFASRFNYEAWIFTKQHKKTMEELEENELMDLASALKKILAKLRKINVSYNFYIHYSPAKEDLHFHIEITPRIATWGGFELSTNAVINSVLPEDAARFYRR